MGEILLIVVVVGFLAGMIPAMLFAGFVSGRQVERQRKELQLRYERQVIALRATLSRLMQRIDVLTGERNKLNRANKGLREVIREQYHATDEYGAELEQSQTELTVLRQKVDALTIKNLRYEGRLEEAELFQDRMSAQFQQTVAQFTEAERLRRNLLFAAKQLRQNHALETNPKSSVKVLSRELDISVIQSIEPLYVERLHESGIHTLDDLANQTPARVAHFAGLSDPDESKEWIAKAKALMNAPPRASA